MKRILVLGLAIVFFAAGCGEKEPPMPAAPPPPPPPSADQISSDLVGALSPLMAYMAQDADIPGVVAEEALKQLRSIKSKHQATENGPAGVSQAANQVAQTLTTAFDSRAWSLCLAAGEALKMLSPTSAESYERKLGQALLQKNRPRVTLTGFFEDKQLETTIISLSVYIPETGVSENMNVREGEEFHDLKLIKILGRNDGIRLEYNKTQDTFDVYIR